MPFSRFLPLFGAHRFCSVSPNDFSTCRMFGIRFSMYWADASFSAPPREFLPGRGHLRLSRANPAPKQHDLVLNGDRAACRSRPATSGVELQLPTAVTPMMTATSTAATRSRRRPRRLGTRTHRDHPIRKRAPQRVGPGPRLMPGACESDTLARVYECHARAIDAEKRVVRAVDDVAHHGGESRSGHPVDIPDGRTGPKHSPAPRVGEKAWVLGSLA